MDKVFIVKIEQGSYDDYNWFIEKICSTYEKAEIIKKEVEDKIESIKNKYLSTYGTSYDDDLKLLNDDDYIVSDDYENTMERFFNFQFLNTELSYNNIYIDEEDVL